MINLCMAASLVFAAGWVHLGPEDRIGGRMVSEGYLRGKTLMVDCRDYGRSDCKDAAKALQDVWDGLKTKPFVLLASHRGTSDKERVGKILEKLGVTYPVYAGADRQGENTIELEPGKVYIFDMTGKYLYSGTDIQRARGVAASAIMALAYPMNLKTWQHVLDYEVKWLPGKAFEHLKEFREKYPNDVGRYAEEWEKFSASEEIGRLAKLETLAHAVKDRDYDALGVKKIDPSRLDNAIEKYADLKKSEDPVVVQEAKNCLAELTWMSAVLKASDDKGKENK